jgi:uncharacterized protein (TIGR03382 family)
MTWGVAILISGGVLLVYVLFRRRKQAVAPDARYICDLCGDRDCECRREEERK